MAEAVAAIGLAASIASLIDVSVKVGARLKEFLSATSEVPESFRLLSVQLPLLSETLRNINQQNQARLSGDVIKTLKDVVSDTEKHVRAVQDHLIDVLPSKDARTKERIVKAMRSLAKEDKVSRAIEKIRQNIEYLTFYQTTMSASNSDRVLDQLSRLTMIPSTMQSSTTSPQPANAPYSLGVCLGNAPQIDADAFIGRQKERAQLRDWLLPMNHPNRQSIASIVGMGGMGKTQLSLAHVRDHSDAYSSIFWLNAKDEGNLRGDMVEMNAIVKQNSLTLENNNDSNLEIEQFRRWLSEPSNKNWLLIFDNYDDPKLPGLKSSTGYDIRLYFPMRSQGSILITSRSPKMAFGKQLKLQELGDSDTCLGILSSRSERDLSQGELHAMLQIPVQTNVKLEDVKAEELTRRVRGLPLALATAGSYIGRTGISCDEYLDLYKTAWVDLIGDEGEELFEYERTMSSTWNISLKLVESQNEDAAKLLKFLAYLSNEDISYELIRAGATEDHPWMVRITESPIVFQRAVSKLQDYSLVEAKTGTYRVHPCLHDWLFASFASPPELKQFTTALICVHKSIPAYSKLPSDWEHNRRVLSNAQRLFSPALLELWSQLEVTNMDIISAACDVAQFVKGWNVEAAATVYERLLAICEKSRGHEDFTTLDLAYRLGTCYSSQTRLELAEQMYRRALTGYEASYGPNSLQTYFMYQQLGNLYDQDRRQVLLTEQMLTAALDGYLKLLGPDNSRTLRVQTDLANHYASIGRFREAEQMMRLVLTRYEGDCPPDHLTLLSTYARLGILCLSEGRLEEAEQLFTQAWSGRQKQLGKNHASTLWTLGQLADTYCAHENFHEAEQAYLQQIDGLGQSYGPSHPSAVEAVNKLGYMYLQQDRTSEAQQMFERAFDSLINTPIEPKAQSIHFIDRFFTSLMGNIHANRHRPYIWRRYIRRLLEAVRERHQDHPYLLGWIGKTMLSLDRDDDAQLAFEYNLIPDGGVQSDYSGAFCDGCSGKITVAMGLHVCRQCPDTYLCNECMEQYPKPTLAMKSCSNHVFFRFNSTRLQNQDNSTLHDRKPLTEWLDTLVEQYQGSEEASDILKSYSR